MHFQTLSSLLITLGLSSLPHFASASPMPISRANVNLEARNNGPRAAFSSPGWLNLTYSSPYRSDKPNIVIMATGGTIAGVGPGAASSGSYTAGVVGVEALVAAVPDLLNISNIYGYQVANVDSGRINSTIQLTLAHAANEILCSSNSVVDGVIVTHGTDTLDETAFFLDLTINCRKPVVIVGAMRPSTAYSADGPANLLQAVTAAVSPTSWDRGTLIVMNDRVGSAWYTQKTHANFLDTFKAPEPGYLGGFYDNKIYYYSSPSTPTFKKTFDVSNVNALPRVDIFYGQQEFDARLLQSALAYGDVKGLIINVPTGGPNASAIINEVALRLPVVRNFRVNNGMVAPDELVNGTSLDPVINSGLVNNHKSRIQLQLALATGQDPRNVFEEPLRGILYGQ